MAFCEECGTKLEGGVKFCSNCGHEVPTKAELVAGAAPVEAAPEVEPPSAKPETEDRPLAEKAEPVVQAVQELVGTVMREVDAPSAIGESTLCTWKNAGAGSLPSAVATAATQAVSTAAQQVAGKATEKAKEVVQDQKAASSPSKKAESRQPHQPTVHSSSQNRSEAAPAVKKSKLPLIVTAAGVVVLVAVFALYVAPRFIFHPVDPNEHTALVSDSAQSASASTSSAAASSESASSSSNLSSASSAASVSSSESASSASATSSSEGASSTSTTTSSASAEASSSATSTSSGATPASSEASSPSSAAASSYSTDERPKIGDFAWLDGEAMKGNAPADAQRIVDFGALMGGWKGYLFDADMEWLANADMEAGQAGATIAIDWYYIRTASGDVREDTTPTSMFAGTFDGGMLDATGSGRITIAAFWQKDGHQYGVGSFMWPSGESSTIALVRP